MREARAISQDSQLEAEHIQDTAITSVHAFPPEKFEEEGVLSLHPNRKFELYIWIPNLGVVVQIFDL